jgi:mannose-6-phosphate isomerase-like protein (cupin superfamily)
VQVARRDALEPFTTLDGSQIRELARMGNQTLAEATVPPGGETFDHFHAFEEVYYFTAGRGRMRLGDQETEVEAGDCVAIPPGTPHRLRNDGEVDLVVVCACSPPYSHEDTVLLEEE